MVRIPTNRPPTHPGEMLLTEFLEPMNLTQRQLAEGASHFLFSDRKLIR